MWNLGQYYVGFAHFEMILRSDWLNNMQTLFATSLICGVLYIGTEAPWPVFRQLGTDVAQTTNLKLMIQFGLPTHFSCVTSVNWELCFVLEDIEPLTFGGFRLLGWYL